MARLATVVPAEWSGPARRWAASSRAPHVLGPGTSSGPARPRARHVLGPGASPGPATSPGPGDVLRDGDVLGPPM